ncbi:MAG: septal ring lytic transglycosylase RlpA family protein [bacterium]|nr:septal ring lytic transglycosylase RlpA family protein [bacterium]
MSRQKVRPLSLITYPLSLGCLLFLVSCATNPPGRTLSGVEGPLPPPSKEAQAPSQSGKIYTVMGQTYRVLGSSRGYVERGMASWYGTKFHGRKTASGEIYDMDKFTAAHRTLPLGTFVKVRRTDCRGESVVVRVNDRGPFVDNRVIDLSRAAATQLDMLEEGTAEVTITAFGEEILRGRPGEVTLKARYDYNEGSFSVQVGAFTVKENAQRLALSMKAEHGAADLSLFDRGDMVFFRVRVGRFESREEAEGFRDNLIRSGEFGQAFVVAR